MKDHCHSHHVCRRRKLETKTSDAGTLANKGSFRNLFSLGPYGSYYIMWGSNMEWCQLFSYN